MVDEVQLSVEVPSNLKLRLDLHCKIVGKTQKEVVTQALEQYIPEYVINPKIDEGELDE